ncbi:MAG: TIGR00299 family protein [Firmicutes bacterium HGW-Firmicutes-12]|jgi:hypothetical protein|nr:MAG: TIGR00299 family protein [Firmicutes bacterium HGW-Firmicutes-12]
MKTAYFDCFSGASGNMIIGAFLDAGVPLEELEKELAKLGLQNEYSLISKRVKKLGIDALYFDVDVHTDHSHNHPNEHTDNLSHTHTNSHTNSHTHSHHRNYSDIYTLIMNSPLAQKVKDLSLQILKRLGEAEAKVHQCKLEDVHFHEVGAVDTIVDIVGASFCLHYLGIEKVYSSPLHTGSGMVNCAHGRMPIPAPATAELLKGASFYSTSVQGELLTPTGAAIITSLTQEFGPQPTLEVEIVAYGAGSWDLEIPNVLRLFIGHTSTVSFDTDTSTVIETTIDDMNPELYGYIMDRLFEVGALEVFLTPIYMKKNRPGTLLTVISTLSDQQPLLDVILKESSTLGVRLRQEKRYKLKRESHTLQTPHGSVRIKLGSHENQINNIAPEYEDCRQIAKKSGLPLKQVYQEALSLALQEFKYE